MFLEQPEFVPLSTEKSIKILIQPYVERPQSIVTLYQVVSVAVAPG